MFFWLVQKLWHILYCSDQLLATVPLRSAVGVAMQSSPLEKRLIVLFFNLKCMYVFAVFYCVKLWF